MKEKNRATISLLFVQAISCRCGGVTVCTRTAYYVKHKDGPNPEGVHLVLVLEEKFILEWIMEICLSCSVRHCRG